jgi:hypothetical protein
LQSHLVTQFLQPPNQPFLDSVSVLFIEMIVFQCFVAIFITQDIVWNGDPRLLLRIEAHPVGTLLGQGGEERLHGSIIITIGRSTHTHLDAQFREQSEIALDGKFAATVGMMQESLRGMLLDLYHVQSQLDQLLVFGGHHGPTHGRVREEIQDHCQIQPALSRCNGFGIRHPFALGLLRRKLAIEMIGGKSHPWITFGGWFARSLRLRRQAELLHQSHDPFA